MHSSKEVIVLKMEGGGGCIWVSRETKFRGIFLVWIMLKDLLEYTPAELDNV